MRSRLAGLVAAGMLVAGCTQAGTAAPRGSATRQPDFPAPPTSAVTAHVVAVTDGDTIVLRGIDVGEVHRPTGGRKARLIGVDTPEVYGPDECFGSNASAFTRNALEGTDVRVAFDVGRIDRYGRALVYVWDHAGRFFNAALLDEGYALQMTVPPNVRYSLLFTELARDARDAGRGLWSEC